MEGWIDQIFGNNMFKTIVDIITFKTVPYETMSAGINGIYENVMLPIGYSLLTLYFLLELMEKTTHDNFNIEHFLRMFIKWLIGALLMQNGLTILDGIRQFGNYIVEDIIPSNGSLSASGVDLPALKAQAKSLHWWETIGVYMALVLPYVCSFIVEITAQIICWSRAIEMLIRTMMAPIAMPDIFGEGLRSNGFRYLKKYAATVLQGAIILGITIVMSSINAALMNDGSTLSLTSIPASFFLNTLVISFSCVTLMMRSKEWANDVVGA